MFNFILGLIVGGIIVWLAMRRPSTSSVPKILNPEQVEKRRENLDKVLQMAREKGEIKNDDVEHRLGVADATATRYLEELEKEGKLEQIGSRGKYVIYRPR